MIRAGRYVSQLAEVSGAYQITGSLRKDPYKRKPIVKKPEFRSSSVINPVIKVPMSDDELTKKRERMKADLLLKNELGALKGNLTKYGT